jgi:hypothetical protein
MDRGPIPKSSIHKIFISNEAFMADTQPRKDKNENQSQEIHREDFIIRPVTTTRTQPLTITVSQRVIQSGEIAMATAIISKHMDLYYEKPDILEDQGMAMIRAAGLMRKLNKKVKNGK